MMEIGLYFGQAAWTFLLDLSNKSAVEYNSYYIKFISYKKESIKCPTAMRAAGKPCITQLPFNQSKKSTFSTLSTKIQETATSIRQKHTQPAPAASTTVHRRAQLVYKFLNLIFCTALPSPQTPLSSVQKGTASPHLSLSRAVPLPARRALFGCQTVPAERAA